MSSSTNRKKTSDDQNKKTSEHTHDSKDQTSKHLPHAKSSRSFFTVECSPVRSNFFAHSVSSPRLNARPFEEILVTPTDAQSETINKPKTDTDTRTDTKQ